MCPREINSAEVELDVARSIQRLKRVVFVIQSRLCCVVFNFSRCVHVLIVYFSRMAVEMSNLAKVVWSVYFSEVKAWGEGGIIGVVSLLLDVELSCQLKSSARL